MVDLKSMKNISNQFNKTERETMHELISEIEQLREERKHEDKLKRLYLDQLANVGREMEQLKREREWLIANWAKDKHYINNLWAVDQHSMDKHKENIIKEMQQSLKE